MLCISVYCIVLIKTFNFIHCCLWIYLQRAVYSQSFIIAHVPTVSICLCELTGLIPFLIFCEFYYIHFIFACFGYSFKASIFLLKNSTSVASTGFPNQKMETPRINVPINFYQVQRLHHKKTVVITLTGPGATKIGSISFGCAIYCRAK